MGQRTPRHLQQRQWNLQSLQEYSWYYSDLCGQTQPSEDCSWWSCWTFLHLDNIYGTWRKESNEKNGYNLPMHKMSTFDLARLMKSDEIQSVLRDPKSDKVKTGGRHVLKKNPLKNFRVMCRLNPNHKSQVKRAAFNEMVNKRKKEEFINKKRGIKTPLKPLVPSKSAQKHKAARAKAKKGGKGKATKAAKKINVFHHLGF